jgi:RND family efflux transporter MFP subunit
MNSSPCPAGGGPETARRPRRAPALLAALIAAAVLAGCGKHGSSSAGASAAPNLPPMKARVITVHTESLPMITEITGTVRPVQRAVVAAKVMGAIDEMPVTLGQRVSAGDLLAKISAGEISARVAQAQSQLNAATRDLERERALLQKGASTADMVRGLEDRFAAAQAMIREAEVMLGYVTLLAPFDGVVTRKMANAGDLASPGVPLLELEGLSNFQVEVGLPDSLAATLPEGASLDVEVPVAGVSFTGKVVEISSAADPLARTVSAKITVPADARVRSGQFARVQVPGTPVRALLAPADAVTRLGQMERVFVAANDDRAILRLVKTGGTRGERVEILTGLDDGERIVVAPPAGMREGQPLEFQP